MTQHACHKCTSTRPCEEHKVQQYQAVPPCDDHKQHAPSPCPPKHEEKCDSDRTSAKATRHNCHKCTTAGPCAEHKVQQHHAPAPCPPKHEEKCFPRQQEHHTAHKVEHESHQQQHVPQVFHDTRAHLPSSAPEHDQSVASHSTTSRSNVEVDIKTEKDIGSTLKHVEHGTEATALLSLLTTLLQSKKVDQIKPLLALLASLGIKVEVEQLIKGVHASGELKEKLTGVVKAEGREKEIEIEKEKVSEVKTKTKASETVDTTKDAQVSRETKRETSDVRNVKDQQFEQQLRRLEDSVVVQLLLAGGFDKTLKLKILARFLAGCHEGSEGDIGKVEELSLVLLLLRLLLETERGVTSLGHCGCGCTCGCGCRYGQYSYGSSSTLHKSLHDRLVAQGRARLLELLDVGSYKL